MDRISLAERSRVFWRRDNALGWKPEVDGPLRVPDGLQRAFRYLYGDPNGERQQGPDSARR